MKWALIKFAKVVDDGSVQMERQQDRRWTHRQDWQVEGQIVDGWTGRAGRHRDGWTDVQQDANSAF